jgi:hypothetical protein
VHRIASTSSTSGGGFPLGLSSLAAALPAGLAASLPSSPADVLARIGEYVHTLIRPASSDGNSDGTASLAPPPVPSPDDTAVLGALGGEHWEGRTAAFVGAVAGTAAVWARTVARVVDAMLAAEGEGGAHAVPEDVWAAVREADDLGVEHGCVGRVDLFCALVLSVATLG